VPPDLAAGARTPAQSSWRSLRRSSRRAAAQRTAGGPIANCD
jgi:hypothetical protein